MPAPEQWRDKLIEKLGHQARAHASKNAYYTGEHPLPDAPPGARAEYLRLMRQARSNWCELIVDAVAERLEVAGVRFGNQQAADVDIWRTIWQPNALDAEHGAVHTEALIGGTASVLVWPSTTETNGRPTITTEHPTEVYVDLDPAARRRARSAIKVYVDDTLDMEFATLWTPPEGDTPAMVYKWARARTSGEWKAHADEGDPGTSFVNPLGRVPLVPFLNKRRMIGAGVSELAGGITDVQDRINETIFNRLTAGRFSAFRQRWVTGMEIPVDPETNKPVEPFKAAVDRLWMSEDPAVKFGEFGATDLAPYIKAVEADIQHLAAITRTPPHYLLGQSGAFPSGESLKATETGLVRKAVARQLSFGESWEDVIRLGLVAMEDARGADDTIEVIWKDPETKGLAELVDALVKLKSLGVPDEALWERYGATQLEIARWRGQAARSTLAAAAASRPATPAPSSSSSTTTPPAADVELEPAGA